jgi:hypothetical protein
MTLEDLLKRLARLEASVLPPNNDEYDWIIPGATALRRADLVEVTVEGYPWFGVIQPFTLKGRPLLGSLRSRPIEKPTWNVAILDRHEGVPSGGFHIRCSELLEGSEGWLVAWGVRDFEP